MGTGLYINSIKAVGMPSALTATMLFPLFRLTLIHARPL